MEAIQIIFIVFALFAFSRSVLRARDRAISRGEFLFWSALWIAVIVVSFIPGIASFFARGFGIRRGVDIAIYFSVILLFYLQFRLYVKLDKVEHDMTRLIRGLAQQEAKKKK